MLPGAVPSPNIWRHTDTYETENRAADPDGRLWQAMRDALTEGGRGGFAGRTVLDLGCGTGFHLPRLADEVGPGGSVVGVEPHPSLVSLARRRVRGLPRVDVREGVAQEVPLPDASVDVVHVRWAYFFGRGCEPGLVELDRVLRPGGTALVVDNDGARSTWGSWFRRGYPHLDPPEETERFWTTRGWTRVGVDMGWRFTSRADLEAVVRIELRPEVADAVLAGHDGLEVDYAVNLWVKHQPR